MAEFGGRVPDSEAWSVAAILPCASRISTSVNFAQPLVKQEEEERLEIKMDDSVDISLASEGTGLFVDLWEAQPCLWDPE